MLGMTKEDLEILPAGMSLMIKDIIYKCRESPPSNWPMQTYELIDRQDLAALDKHLKPRKLNQYVTSEAKNYPVKDLEQDDGMEFDNTVYINTYYLFCYVY